MSVTGVTRALAGVREVPGRCWAWASGREVFLSAGCGAVVAAPSVPSRLADVPSPIQERRAGWVADVLGFTRAAVGRLITRPADEELDESPGVTRAGFVDAVTSAAALAQENRRLRSELSAESRRTRASLLRIVRSADAARARLERDLHDGAQQRLVAALIALRVVEGRLSNAAPKADEGVPVPTDAELLAGVLRSLEDAIVELRELTRGLHPTVLTQVGLSAAVRDLADRSPLTVLVDAAAPPDLEAEVSATAYFVVAEALTNVLKHAEAAEVRVVVREGGRGLVVSVADDGRGGARASAGCGIAGLVDRVAAVGGHLTVRSTSSNGTTLVADLPLHVAGAPP